MYVYVPLSVCILSATPTLCTSAYVCTAPSPCSSASIPTPVPTSKFTSSHPHPCPGWTCPEAVRLVSGNHNAINQCICHVSCIQAPQIHLPRLSPSPLPGLLPIPGPCFLPPPGIQDLFPFFRREGRKSFLSPVSVTIWMVPAYGDVKAIHIQ